jgi:Nucleotide modification associated domain 3
VNALLVRVAADQSKNGGRWNGPVDPITRKFVYVPIPEQYPSHPGLNLPFSPSPVATVLANSGISMPSNLLGTDMHLDPDFRYLTYGDSDSRANQIQSKLRKDDLLVFYAGLRDIHQPRNRLYYALIGLYVIDDVQLSTAVPMPLWHKNAHTRRQPCPGKYQIVIFARSKVSGRLDRCIPIGSYRQRAYRVFPHLLQMWGGLSVKDGYIQRSGRLPEFLNTAQFYSWFQGQNVARIASNN